MGFKLTIDSISAGIIFFSNRDSFPLVLVFNRFVQFPWSTVYLYAFEAKSDCRLLNDFMLSEELKAVLKTSSLTNAQVKRDD
jgi:hypothetical protein